MKYYVKAEKVKGEISSHIFKCVLNNEEMNKKIVQQIDSQGDKQNYKFNVKAQMTDWYMSNKPGFLELQNIVTIVIDQISKEKYGDKKYTPALIDLWGLKYKSNDYAVKHNHMPCLYSFSYYINPPVDGPELSFPEFNFSVKPENGMLIIFESWIEHEVIKKSFEGYRYVVSGNYR
jgi:hypothetical protein